MPEQRKIALVYDAIYPYTKGGAERRYYELGKRLGKHGFEVHLYGMKFWDGPKVIKEDGLILHGMMKARPLYTKSGRRSIAQAILFGLSALQLLWADFDVIDCCGFPYFSLFPAKLAAVLRRKPLFATWHEVWGREYWEEYLGKLGIFGYGVEKLASYIPNTVIAVSDMTSRQFIKELCANKTVHIIPNGIDYARISRLKPAEDASDVIYVGRLMDFKHVDMLIKAIGKFKQKGKIVQCLIVGEGPEEPKLRQLCDELKISKQVRWRGFTEHSDDVYALMKSSMVLVLPSSREGFGMVVLEANACGKAVLTANFSQNAARDLVHEGVNGLIFEPTIKNLAAVMGKTRTELKALGHSAQEFSKAYDWNSLCNSLNEVYVS
jgi:glycosyltransferase involved in cell wall biosynthesis